MEEEENDDNDDNDESDSWVERRLANAAPEGAASTKDVVNGGRLVNGDAVGASSGDMDGDMEGEEPVLPADDG